MRALNHPLLEPGGFLMEHRTMRSIKHLAESAYQP